MTKLTLIQSNSGVQKKARAKRRVRPDGYLRCNRCGSHTIVTVTNGSFIKNGIRHGGTVIVKDVCHFCYKQNIISPMMPELESVK